MKAIKTILAASALLVSGFATAGKFETWSDLDGKGNIVVVVSFAGDGATQDAQVDFKYPADWSLLKAVPKVAGSVCVVNSEKGFVRVVPPSGAGKALTSKQTDYCSFMFKSTAKTTNIAGLEQVFTECAASTGSKACDADFVNLSEK